MKAHFQLFVHGNCTQWVLEKSFLECSKRKFQMNLHSQESWSLQNKHLSPQCCMKKKDAGVMKRSIMGDHERMMMINNSKASDPDISHSSIFIDLNNGGSCSSSSSSSTNIDTPELALSSSVFIESDGDGDDDYCSFRGLVLDLSYRPINVVCWKRALCLQIMEKADVLEYYDQAVKSTDQDYFIPAVLRVSSFIYAPKQKKVRLSLNRRNVLYRDRFKCQYCGARDNLTMDHVLAASRGGKWEWENLVTACSSCNVKKGNKTLEEARMKLMKSPREPKEMDSVDMPHGSINTYRRLDQRRSPPPTQWLDYLPKHTYFF
ncbi:unnamed protein product [Sphagnum tenellum]